VRFYTLSFPHYLYIAAGKCPGYVKVRTGKCLTPTITDRCRENCTRLSLREANLWIISRRRRVWMSYRIVSAPIDALSNGRLTNEQCTP